MKIVTSVGCIINPYLEKNPEGENLQVVRYPRSDTLIRLLQGEDLYRINYEELEKWTPYFQPLLNHPFDNSEIDAFLWTSFQDHISKFYFYKNIPLCVFVPPDKPEFFKKFPLLQSLSPEIRKKNREEIDRLLNKINPECKKGFLIYDKTRLKCKKDFYGFLEEAEEEMIEHMSTLGWIAYRMKPNAPPMKEDLYWAHYEKQYSVEIIEEILQDLTQSILP